MHWENKLRWKEYLQGRATWSFVLFLFKEYGMARNFLRWKWESISWCHHEVKGLQLKAICLSIHLSTHPIMCLTPQQELVYLFWGRYCVMKAIFVLCLFSPFYSCLTQSSCLDLEFLESYIPRYRTWLGRHPTTEQSGPWTVSKG